MFGVWGMGLMLYVRRLYLLVGVCIVKNIAEVEADISKKELCFFQGGEYGAEPADVRFAFFVANQECGVAVGEVVVVAIGRAHQYGSFVELYVNP